MAKARDIPGLHASMPFAEAAAATVAVRAAELFEHAEGVLDTSDIERVHDMRVASRRLRAVLKDVKALADALGERRDRDVAIDAMTKIGHSLTATDRRGIDHLVEELRDEQRGANVELAAALQVMEESDLRGRLRALAAAA